MTLRWDYNLDGGTLRVVEWTDRTTGQSIGEIRPPSSPVVFPSFRARFKISETETEATLTIINVTESDTGEYSCRVQTQDFQQIISTVRLDVLCKYKYLSDLGALVCKFAPYHMFMISGRQEHTLGALHFVWHLLAVWKIVCSMPASLCEFFKNIVQFEPKDPVMK